MANSFKPRLQVNNVDLASILEDINSLPPAGTEDISVELNALSDAVDAHLKMVNRKVAENNGEGQYVWKKRSGKRIYLSQITDSVNPTVLQVTSDTTDLSKVNASWFVGFKGTFNINTATYNWEIISETHITLDNETVTYTYDPVTARLSMNISLYLTNRTWNGYEENVTEECVVSDDENAYPDGGELDGYWYERVNTEIKELWDCLDIIVPTVDTLTLPHTLGTTPTFACIIGIDDIPIGQSKNYVQYMSLGAAGNSRMGCVQHVSSQKAYGSAGYYDVTNTASAVGVASSKPWYFKAGVQYAVYTWA